MNTGPSTVILVNLFVCVLRVLFAVLLVLFWYYCILLVEWPNEMLFHKMVAALMQVLVL